MKRRGFISVVGFGACGLAVPRIALAGAPRIAIIVGMESSVQSLSFHELKQMFMGERLKAPSGDYLVPLNRAAGAERVLFEEKVLGMKPEVAEAYWIDRKIRGQSGPPKVIPSADLVLKLVNKMPGAVGYVLAEAAQGVRVVKIDGKAPGDSGYRIA